MCLQLNFAILYITCYWFRAKSVFWKVRTDTLDVFLGSYLLDEHTSVKYIEHSWLNVPLMKQRTKLGI